MSEWNGCVLRRGLRDETGPFGLVKGSFGPKRSGFDANPALNSSNLKPLRYAAVPPRHAAVPFQHADVPRAYIAIASRTEREFRLLGFAQFNILESDTLGFTVSD